MDLFKKEFKKYKRRDKPLDLSAVFDLEKFNDTSTVSQVRCQESNDIFPQIAGLKSPDKWNVVHFTKHEGFYLIQNPFVAGCQRYWVSRCLEDLPRPPNVTNLRVHPDIDPDILWSQFAADYTPSVSLDNTSPLRKLRWTTIGYHYNWDTKEYCAQDYTEFPEDVGLLTQFVAHVLGFRHFQAQAGIINYYHLDSTLGGHTDHSELDHDAPLISVSFGQDAIFLLGGETKEVKPTAILLRSGDVCVMSGKSRLAYHAVPRILRSNSNTGTSEFSLPPCFELNSGDAVAEKGSERKESDAGNENTEPVETPIARCQIVGKCGSTAVPCTAGEDLNSGMENPRFSVKTAHTLSGDVFICSCPTPRMECSSCRKQESVHQREENVAFGGVEKALDYKNSTEVLPESNSTEIPPENGRTEMLQESSSSEIPPENELKSLNCLKQADKQQTACESTLVVARVNQQIREKMQKLNWPPLAAYLSSSRLNMNVRQVLRQGQRFPQAAEHGDSLQKKPRIDGAM